MTFEEEFKARLRSDLKEAVDRYVDEVTEEFRESMRATLTKNVEDFVNRVSVQVKSRDIPWSLQKELVLEVRIDDSGND